MGDFFSLLAAAFIGFLFGIALIVTPAKELGFKEGQIAAINGDIYYELQVNDLGERVWTQTRERE